MTLCTLVACRSRALRVSDYPKRLGASEYAWTELDYLRAGVAEAEKMSGSRRFSPFFEGEALSLRFQAGLVRIEARREAAEEAWTSDLGSGLAFDAGGRVQVLTARHVVGPPRPGVKCFATLESGDQLEITSLAQPRSAAGADVALLQLEVPEDAAANVLAAWTARPGVRAARRGEPVVVVGYPGGMVGVDATGSVRWSPPHRGAALKPLYVFGEVVTEAPLTLRFRAGVVPMRGMSGGPVWGADGALLGVLAAGSQDGQDGIYEFRGDCEPVTLLFDEELR
jgi:S1-C subfamily serine protease